MRRAIAVLSLIGFLAVVAAGRLVGAAHVFTTAGIFLVDADCYARLQRALPVYEGRQWIVRHHAFENAPEGVTPHTTAPLDWLLAGLARLIAFRTGDGPALEVAGAILPVLLGLASAGLVWAWARRLPGPARWLGPMLFAASPAIAWTSTVGRPDHQALVFLFVTAALVFEWPREPGGRTPELRWEMYSGLFWGLALWVSLYEPLVLFVCRLAGRVLAGDRPFRNRAFLRGLATTGCVLLIAMALEGWRIHAIPAELQGFARAWAATIGELRPGWKHPGMLLGAVGTGLVAAPLLLLRPPIPRRHALASVLVLATLLLALWQIRWAPFLALAYILSLPAQLRQMRSGGWIAAAVPALLWPMLGEWDRRLDHLESETAQITLAERVSLRAAAAHMEPGAIFLAPWWLSPPVAWWSRGAGVAGSSHESLAGIRDACRFYALTDDDEARAIAERRKVRYVMAIDPGPVLENASALLGPAGAAGEPLAARLFRRPGQPPGYLRVRWTDGRVHLFERVATAD